MKSVEILFNSLVVKLDNLRTAKHIRKLRFSNLKIQDKCYVVGLLKDLANQSEIAELCGLSQPYVGKLIYIYNNLKQNIFNRWRTVNIKIPVIKIISLARLPKDQQDQVFNNLITGKTTDNNLLELSVR